MTNQEFFSEHWNDANGNPAGGVSSSCGVGVSWQKGPLGQGDDRREPNGAFVETIIRMAIDRLAFYQQSKFECQNNELAILALNAALGHLRNRTQDREVRKVEGTHVR